MDAEKMYKNLTPKQIKALAKNQGKTVPEMKKLLGIKTKKKNVEKIFVKKDKKNKDKKK